MVSVVLRAFAVRTGVALFLACTIAACSGGSNVAPVPQAHAAVAAGGDAPQPQAQIKRVQLFPMHPLGVDVTAAKPQSIVYPANLQYYGGALLKSAHVYNVFVNSGEANFGDVRDFEEHLSYSSMMHMTDEYVGATGSNRYDWSGDVSENYTVEGTLGDNDILTILHSAAKEVGGGGYGRIYNIFLPKGTNYCSTGSFMASGDCNASQTSPNPSFCAFHGSVVFGDLGETLFTLQPYTDTNYCGIDNAMSNPAQSTPNGLQDDSQYSQLAHELFETITDPDVSQGWYDDNIGVNGELADLCAYIPQNTDLDGRTYRIQLMYSNAQHGCNNAAP